MNTHILRNVSFEKMDMDEISISVHLPLDKDGFLRRECPHCERQFKQWQGRRDEVQESPETYYGNSFDPFQKQTYCKRCRLSFPDVCSERKVYFN